MKSIFIIRNWSFILPFLLLITGCQSHNSTENSLGEGLYEVSIIEAGQTQQQTWSFEEENQQWMITNTTEGYLVEGSLLDHRLSVPAQTVTNQYQEIFMISMEIQFETDFQSWVGTQTLTQDRLRITTSITGKKS